MGVTPDGRIRVFEVHIDPKHPEKEPNISQVVFAKPNAFHIRRFVESGGRSSDIESLVSSAVKDRAFETTLRVHLILHDDQENGDYVMISIGDQCGKKMLLWPLESLASLIQKPAEDLQAGDEFPAWTWPDGNGLRVGLLDPIVSYFTVTGWDKIPVLTTEHEEALFSS